MTFPREYHQKTIETAIARRENRGGYISRPVPIPIFDRDGLNPLVSDWMYSTLYIRFECDSSYIL